MLKIIDQIFHFLLDSLFPINNLDRILFSLSREQAYISLRPSPPTPFHFIKSVFAYKDELVRCMVWNIKYKRSKKALEIGGYALQRYISETFDLANNESQQILLIPIPISTRRKNERGYNQCELMINEIIKFDIDNSSKKLIFSKNLLKRKIHRDRQTLKNRNRRLEDAKKIFEIELSELQRIEFATKLPITTDKLQVLVIDDVVTTGSTMKEAVELLSSIGFKNVSGISLAH
jgi:ComF family protein